VLRLSDGFIFHVAPFGWFEAKSLADIKLSPDKWRNLSGMPGMLDAPDAAHLIQDLKRRGKLLVHLCFPNVPHMRTQHKRNEQYQLPPVPAFLRPASLAFWQSIPCFSSMSS
jgi:hypothetical protein